LPSPLNLKSKKQEYSLKQESENGDQPMTGYLVRRLAQNLLTYFLFLTMVYFLVDAQPGDFGSTYTGDPRLTAAMREALKARLGLDKSVGERYLIWLKNFAQGDLGIAFSEYPRPVMEVIAERAPRTLVLFMTATMVSFYFGFITGKLMAWRRGNLTEYIGTVAGVMLYTVFTPWFGLMMILLFAFYLNLFPIGRFNDAILWSNSPVQPNFVFLRMIWTGGLAGIALFILTLFVRTLDPFRRRSVELVGIGVILLVLVGYWWNTGVGKYALDILHHLILPIVTLALINFAGTMLLTRNSMLETLREDYIMTARAKGLPDKMIRDKHAARNALLPVVTSFVFALAFALDGGVITETIFSWPGMGLTLLRAAQVEDIPMVIGGLVFTGALALTAHLVADILYAYLDPRIRYA
jgi:peptide/nickel transport system permease protein